MKFKRAVSAVWRMALMLAVYALLGVPVTGLVLPGAGGQSVTVPMLFQALLRGAGETRGFYPSFYLMEDWLGFLSAYAMNCLAFSLALLLAWNLLYAPRGLGRRHERSARLAIWAFAALHEAGIVFYAYTVMTMSADVWNWLARQPAQLTGLLLLPELLVVPFWLCARLLCPYRVCHVFPLAMKLRGALRLRVYSSKVAGLLGN